MCVPCILSLLMPRVAHRVLSQISGGCQYEAVSCAVLYLATSVPCAVLYLLLLHLDTLGGEGEECATIVLCRVLCCLPLQPLPRVRLPHTVVYSIVYCTEIQSMLGFC